MINVKVYCYFSSDNTYEPKGEGSSEITLGQFKSIVDYFYLPPDASMKQCNDAADAYHAAARHVCVSHATRSELGYAFDHESATNHSLTPLNALLINDSVSLVRTNHYTREPLHSNFCFSLVSMAHAKELCHKLLKQQGQSQGGYYDRT